MDKWTGMALVVFVVFAFGGMAIGNYTKSQSVVEMAKAGLEECPIGDSRVRTIWVKSCTEYKKTEK